MAASSWSPYQFLHAVVLALPAVQHTFLINLDRVAGAEDDVLVAEVGEILAIRFSLSDQAQIPATEIIASARAVDR